MREVSLLNEGEFKGFFDREMHALLLLSLRSLPPEFKMSLSASLSATSLIGIAPFLPISRSSCPLSSSTGSLVVVLSGFHNRIWRSFTKWVGS